MFECISPPLIIVHTLHYWFIVGSVILVSLITFLWWKRLWLFQGSHKNLMESQKPFRTVYSLPISAENRVLTLHYNQKLSKLRYNQVVKNCDSLD